MGIGPSQPKVSSKDKAILELKVQRDKLKQYEKKVVETLSSFNL
jgi:charged multivesicular body protein 6